MRTIYFDPLATPEDLEKLASAHTRMVYLESPGSYTFEIQDVPAICAWARQRGNRRNGFGIMPLMIWATHVLQWRKQSEAKPRGQANHKNNVSVRIVVCNSTI